MERRLLRRELGGQFIHCRLAGIEAFVLDSEFYLHDLHTPHLSTRLMK